MCQFVEERFVKCSLGRKSRIMRNYDEIAAAVVRP